jgi:hypothetical protein
MSDQPPSHMAHATSAKLLRVGRVTKKTQGSQNQGLRIIPSIIDAVFCIGVYVLFVGVSETQPTMPAGGDGGTSYWTGPVAIAQALNACCASSTFAVGFGARILRGAAGWVARGGFGGSRLGLRGHEREAAGAAPRLYSCTGPNSCTWFVR